MILKTLEFFEIKSTLCNTSQGGMDLLTNLVVLRVPNKDRNLNFLQGLNKSLDEVGEDFLVLNCFPLPKKC